MGDGATTVAPVNQETTPEGQAVTTPATPVEESTPSKEVVELKAQVEELGNQVKRFEAIAKDAQRKERVSNIERKKLDDQLKKIQSGEAYIPSTVPEGETTTEREVRLNARIGIQNLILSNPDYQELLEQDITLREVMMNNPFAIIGEFFDAEDAVSQIKEKLDSRVSSLAPQPPAKGGEKGGVEFEVGAIQPKSEPPPPPKPAQTGISQDAVEQSIKSKIKFGQ